MFVDRTCFQTSCSSLVKIHSPIPAGSGASIVHAALASRIDGYSLRHYSAWWALFPPALFQFSSRDAGVIHANSDLGVFHKQPGVPLVVTVHNYTSDRFMRPYSSAFQYLHYRTDLRLFTRMTINAASVVVTISRFIGELLQKDLGIEKPMRLIYNGIDANRFAPSTEKTAHKRFRVLFCGNPNRRKRAQLIAPLAEGLGAGFEIVYTEGLSGSGYDPGYLSGSAAEVRSLGHIAHRDMPDVYRNVDLLFMPSVREGFGLCVAEAMSSGLPIVACDNGVMRELVIDRQSGFLCGIDDIAGYVKGIRTIADNPDMARQMGQLNRVRVEQHFTLDRMVTQYQALFAELADRGNAAV